MRAASRAGPGSSVRERAAGDRQTRREALNGARSDSRISAPAGSGLRLRSFAFWRGEMAKVPMTVTGAERLKAELQRLRTVERPAVIQALADARSHGDLSENADYDAAKERQGFIEGRIAEVESRLANAQVIDPAGIDANGQVGEKANR